MSAIRCRIAVIIIGTRVVGVEPAGADRVIELTDFAVALTAIRERSRTIRPRQQP